MISITQFVQLVCKKSTNSIKLGDILRRIPSEKEREAAGKTSINKK